MFKLPQKFIALPDGGCGLLVPPLLGQLERGLAPVGLRKRPEIELHVLDCQVGLGTAEKKLYNTRVSLVGGDLQGGYPPCASIILPIR